MLVLMVALCALCSHIGGWDGSRKNHSGTCFLQWMTFWALHFQFWLSRHLRFVRNMLFAGNHILSIAETLEQWQRSPFNCMSCFSFRKLGKGTQKVVSFIFGFAISRCWTDDLFKEVELSFQGGVASSFSCSSCVLLSFWTSQVWKSA